MADWIGSCRSNYFIVKDRKSFKELLEQYETVLIEKNGKVGFYSITDDGGIPTRYIDDDEDAGIDEESISIIEEIAEHLVENEVCVIMEIGYEKLRYLDGRAIAVAWTGETTRVSLNDIYAQAQSEFGGDAQITEAIY